MDPFSHALLGAAVAQSAARKAQVRLAAGAGAAAALLPDIDFFLESAGDPLFNIEYHRHFTHSLFFAPVGALIAAGLLWLLLRRRARFPQLYLFATLAYVSAVLLDAATSYGTQLLLPVSDARIAWNIIAIIDPLFTLVLAVAVLVAVIRGSPLAARIGLALAVLYLGFGFYQREQAADTALALAMERGHGHVQVDAKPTLGNLILWRAIYEIDGRFQVDAVRVPPFGSPRIYPGASVARFEPEAQPALREGSVLHEDIRRFARFSDGYIALHPDDPSILGDVRYAMLPNDVRPLWGIELDFAEQDRHAEFHTFRRADAATRQVFFDMLRGRPVDVDAARP